MTNKLNELAEQAEVLTDQEWHRLAQSTDGMPERRSVFNQKFAELIVAESIQVIEELQDGYGDAAIAQSIDNTAQVLALSIAKIRIKVRLGMHV